MSHSGSVHRSCSCRTSYSWKSCWMPCRYDWGYTPEVLGSVAALQWSPDNRALAVRAACCAKSQPCEADRLRLIAHADELLQLMTVSYSLTSYPGGLGVAGHRGLVAVGVPADVLAAAGGARRGDDAPHRRPAAIALHSSHQRPAASAGGAHRRCADVFSLAYVSCGRLLTTRRAAASAFHGRPRDQPLPQRCISTTRLEHCAVVYPNVHSFAADFGSCFDLQVAADDIDDAQCHCCSFSVVHSFVSACRAASLRSRGAPAASRCCWQKFQPPRRPSCWMCPSRTA